MAEDIGAGNVCWPAAKHVALAITEKSVNRISIFYLTYLTQFAFYIDFAAAYVGGFARRTRAPSIER
jgi:hypothetical protein